MAKVNKKNEQHIKIQEVQERALDKLDELFDMLWEEAQGVTFVVSPSARKSEKPKGAKMIGEAEAVEKICRSCKQPVLKEPREVWEVWQEKRDSILLKFLYEQLAGKAAAKAQEQVDPELVIILGDIDCVSGDKGEEVKAVAVPVEEAQEEKVKIGL